MEHQRMGLSELNARIQESLHTEFDRPLWITAEISELKVNTRGHCYLDLIEKTKDTGKLKARMRGIIWAYSFRMLKPYFEGETGQELQTGLKVLVKAEVSFHEFYGLSLMISDIDPQFTLGDLALRREESIRKLKEEGVWDMNPSLELPVVLQQVAVVSSPKAAGYEDFCKQLDTNVYGYAVGHVLFEAAMQGDALVPSVTVALENILQYEDKFDAVLLLRGGGSRTDLGNFDEYALAQQVAQYPLPVIVGVGHERDLSVTDMVAHTSVKTPTAAAGFILGHNQQFEAGLGQIALQVQRNARRLLQEHTRALTAFDRELSLLTRRRLEQAQNQLGRTQWKLASAAQNQLRTEMQAMGQVPKLIRRNIRYLHYKQGFALQNTPARLQQAARAYLKTTAHTLSLAQAQARQADPENALKRGYALISKNGKLLSHAQNLQTGDEIAIHMQDAGLQAQISKIEKHQGRKD